MGRKMLNKLRSRKGASLTFALLAFLVCAVISAVLLAAGMASAGRLSGLAEADQRYYAVTSAAQLFCDSLQAEDQAFTLRRVYITEETDIYSSIVVNQTVTTTKSHLTDNSYELSIMIPGTTPEEHSIGTKSEVAALRGTSFLADAAITYFAGDLSTVSNDASAVATYVCTQTKTASSEITDIRTWDISISSTAGSLPVKATATMKSNGSIEIEFSNSDTGNKPFSVIVTLVPVVTPEKTNTTQTPWNVLSDSPTYREETRTTRTSKTMSVSWTVSSVKKVSA